MCIPTDLEVELKVERYAFSECSFMSMYGYVSQKEHAKCSGGARMPTPIPSLLHTEIDNSKMRSTTSLYATKSTKASMSMFSGRYSNEYKQEYSYNG